MYQERVSSRILEGKAFLMRSSNVIRREVQFKNVPTVTALLNAEGTTCEIYQERIS